MNFARIEDLPATGRCNKCSAEKSVSEMVVVRNRKTGVVSLRPRCKACHNEFERGHRREYKRNYLRRWRGYHPELQESYTEKYIEANAERIEQRWRKRIRERRIELLIQRRLKNAGIPCTFAEACALLEKFGPCYPTPRGLTPAGRAECERIRSRMRRKGKALSNLEIRIMVYEDGFFVTPGRQPRVPYPGRGSGLRAWRAKNAESAA